MEHQISGSGCRPTINSYLYADAVAISPIAALARRADLADEFAERALRLKSLVQQRLWDDKAQFFKTLPTKQGRDADERLYGSAALGLRQHLGVLADVRELQGYVPWTFHLPDSGFEAASGPTRRPRWLLRLISDRAPQSDAIPPGGPPQSHSSTIACGGALPGLLLLPIP